MSAINLHLGDCMKAMEQEFLKQIEIEAERHRQFI
jgi:hypothetical protein